jgi:hypothetical protein
LLVAEQRTGFSVVVRVLKVAYGVTNKEYPKKDLD